MEETLELSGSRTSFVGKFESLAITSIPNDQKGNKAIRRYKNSKKYSPPPTRIISNESSLIHLIKSWSLEDVFNQHLFKSKVLYLFQFPFHFCFYMYNVHYDFLQTILYHYHYLKPFHLIFILPVLYLKGIYVDLLEPVLLIL